MKKFKFLLAIACAALGVQTGWGKSKVVYCVTGGDTTIGAIEFTSLYTAFADAAPGKSLYKGDVSLSASYGTAWYPLPAANLTLPKDGELILNLNSVSYLGWALAVSGETEGHIYVNTGAKLTINGPGKIGRVDTYNAPIIYCASGSTLILNNVDIDTSYLVIEASDATVIINNGNSNFISGSPALRIHDASSVTLNGGKLKGVGTATVEYTGSGTFTMSGGSIENENTVPIATVGTTGATCSFICTKGSLKAAACYPFASSAGSLNVNLSNCWFNDPFYNNDTYRIPNLKDGTGTTLTLGDGFCGLLYPSCQDAISGSVIDHFQINSKTGTVGGNSYNCIVERKTHGIAWYKNDGSGESYTFASEYMSYPEGLGMNSFPTPTRTGYLFGGWFSTAACSGSAVTSIGTDETANKAFYAKWTAKKYDLVLKDDATTLDTVSSGLTFDAQIPASVSTFPSAKTGYDFDGYWNGSTQYYNASGVRVWTDYWTTDGDLTVSAKWNGYPYTVKFNANGGEGSMADEAMTYGTKQKLTANAYTRSGYSFLGWSTSQTATSATYADQAEVKDLTETKNGTVNLYAIWTPRTTTVTLAQNGATTEGTKSVSATYGSAMPALAALPSRTGYGFAGYSDGSKTYYAANGSSAANWDKDLDEATLTAQWTPNTYTIAFDKNDADATGSTASLTGVKYGASVNLTLNGFQKAGFTFLGWATEPSGDKEYDNGATVSNLSSVDGATVTLYAKWRANVSVVKYEGGTGATGSCPDLDAPMNQTVTLAGAGHFALAGKAQTGWLCNGQTYDLNGTFTAPEGGKTYTMTAVWADAVASIGSVNYVTLKEAFDAVTATSEGTRQTIDLLKNATIAEDKQAILDVGKFAKLNLHVYSITCARSNAIFNKGNLIITADTNATLDNAYICFNEALATQTQAGGAGLFDNQGTFVLEGGAICSGIVKFSLDGKPDYSNLAGYNYAIKCRSNSSTTITGKGKVYGWRALISFGTENVKIVVGDGGLVSGHAYGSDNAACFAIPSGNVAEIKANTGSTFDCAGYIVLAEGTGSGTVDFDGATMQSHLMNIPTPFPESAAPYEPLWNVFQIHDTSVSVTMRNSTYFDTNWQTDYKIAGGQTVHSLAYGDNPNVKVYAGCAFKSSKFLIIRLWQNNQLAEGVQLNPPNPTAANQATTEIDIGLSSYFGNKMVLQRNAKTTFFGANRPVGSTFAAVLKDANGTQIASGAEKPSTGGTNWEIELDLTGVDARSDSLTVSFTCDGTVVQSLTDVLIGDLWLCGGQSNMRVTNYVAAADAVAAYDKVRQCSVVPSGSASSAAWNDVVNAYLAPYDNLGTLTLAAMSFWFGDMLQKGLDSSVPIGVVNVSVGATAISMYMRKISNPDAAGMKVNAFLDVESTQSKTDAGAYWDALVEPMVGKIPFKGCIWYQGESDALYAQYYQGDFIDMYTQLWVKFAEQVRSRLNGLRPADGKSDIPFYYMQIASWDIEDYEYSASDGSRCFAAVREGQRLAAHSILEPSGMATAFDMMALDGNGHPHNKKEMAARLVGQVLNEVYGKSLANVENPEIAAVSFSTAKWGELTVTINNVGEGLENAFITPTLYTNWVNQANAPEDKVSVWGFEIWDGTTWHPAQAAINSDNTITIKIPGDCINGPTQVAYGYHNASSGYIYDSSSDTTSQTYPLRQAEWMTRQWAGSPTVYCKTGRPEGNGWMLPLLPFAPKEITGARVQDPIPPAEEVTTDAKVREILGKATDDLLGKRVDNVTEYAEFRRWISEYLIRHDDAMESAYTLFSYVMDKPGIMALDPEKNTVQITGSVNDGASIPNHPEGVKLTAKINDFSFGPTPRGKIAQDFMKVSVSTSPTGGFSMDNAEVADIELESINTETVHGGGTTITYTVWPKGAAKDAKVIYYKAVIDEKAYKSK